MRNGLRCCKRWSGLEVQKAFRAVRCDRFVGVAHRVGAQIAELVSNVQMAPHLLFELAKHDTSTFVHVTNVAAYAVLLAQALGIRSSKELQQIAVGAMLHDIGKRNLPPELLNKPGRLTDREHDQMLLHPLRGFEELCKRKDLSHGQLMMVYQHHEWVDGSGYPVGDFCGRDPPVGETARGCRLCLTPSRREDPIAIPSGLPRH